MVSQLFAPCVRLECRLEKHTLAIEFQFNECGGKQLFDFKWSSRDMFFIN